MRAVGDELLEQAVAEISLRDPSFLERHSVGLGGLDHDLVEGLARRGVRLDGKGAQPLVANVLADSARDALAADEGRLPLRPAPRQALDLDAAYERRSAEGVDYLVRRTGSRWLVLVNAVGVPLALWSRLLADPDHDYRILVVEPAGSDLVEGGMHADSPLDADVERIQRVLQAEGIDRFSVLGWCSGGRTAVELAGREGSRVEALVLASASFRGAGGGSARPTQFEEDVGAVFGSVRRNPASAAFLSEMLVKSQGMAPSVDDANLLFRLPDRSQAAHLTAPFANGEALRCYAARLASDWAHPLEAALAQVTAPVLAITGAHDHILDNAVTLSVLRTSIPDAAAVEVSGAGHYVHDLQYPYFRMVLDAFLAGRPAPASARVRVV